MCGVVRLGVWHAVIKILHLINPFSPCIMNSLAPRRDRLNTSSLSGCFCSPPDELSWIVLSTSDYTFTPGIARKLSGTYLGVDGATGERVARLWLELGKVGHLAC